MLKSQTLFLLLFPLFIISGCRQNDPGNTGQSLQEEVMELSKINGFPEEIMGCSCYLAENAEDLKNQKFLYLEKYGAPDEEKNISMIAINGEIVKFRSSDNPSAFKVELHYNENERVDLEVFNRSGILKVAFKNGTVIEKNFVGVCGC